MKRILLFLLGISLAANVWLLRPARSSPPATPAWPAIVGPSAALARGVDVAALEAGDPAVIRDALRADGADENTVRAVLDGVLRQRHREKLAGERIERVRRSWWRNGRVAQAGDGALLKQMVTEPMQRLLGLDPLELLDAESRYAFLPPEKRRKLAQIDRDYAEMEARRPSNLPSAQLRAVTEEDRLLAEEQRKDVLAALSPPEREEYDLRFAESAGQVSRRAGAMVATETEYRAIKPLMDEFERKPRTLPRGEVFSPGAAEELERAMAQQLVAAIGYDRALDYIWAAYESEYSALRRATEGSGLPANTPARVMELSVEAGRRAAQIHGDATLTPEQRKAALPALQQAMRGQLDALMPAAAQQKLPADGLRWLTILGTGSYQVPMPSLSGSGLYIVMEITTPEPPKRSDFTSALPPRPPGR